MLLLTPLSRITNMYLFVYGTLKRGYGNHVVLGNAKFVDEYVLKDNYYMVDLGPFPAAIKTDSIQGTIIGELYQIDNDILKNTDRLEGYPSYYGRSIVNTKYGDAFIYHFTGADRAAKLPIITEWHPHRRYA